MQTLQLNKNEPESTKLYVYQRWDVRNWQFFRYLKKEKSLNPLCFTVSFSQRAASQCNSKIGCFIRSLCCILTQGLSSLCYNANSAGMSKSEPKSYSSLLSELPYWYLFIFSKLPFFREWNRSLAIKQQYACSLILINIIMLSGLQGMKDKVKVYFKFFIMSWK